MQIRYSIRYSIRHSNYINGGRAFQYCSFYAVCTCFIVPHLKCIYVCVSIRFCCFWRISVFICAAYCLFFRILGSLNDFLPKIALVLLSTVGAVQRRCQQWLCGYRLYVARWRVRISVVVTAHQRPLSLHPSRVDKWAVAWVTEVTGRCERGPVHLTQHFPTQDL